MYCTRRGSTVLYLKEGVVYCTWSLEGGVVNCTLRREKCTVPGGRSSVLYLEEGVVYCTWRGE